MQIFFKIFGYHNEHHVEIWLQYFSFSSLFRSHIEPLAAIWIHDANKKSLVLTPGGAASLGGSVCPLTI
jgi:hypothetical protein